MSKLNIVGSAEAAEILGVERPRINRWRNMGVMPATVADLRCGPIWNRTEIEVLAKERSLTQGLRGASRKHPKA